MLLFSGIVLHILQCFLNTIEEIIQDQPLLIQQLNEINWLQDKIHFHKALNHRSIYAQ